MAFALKDNATPRMVNANLAAKPKVVSREVPSGSVAERAAADFGMDAVGYDVGEVGEEKTDLAAGF